MGKNEFLGKEAEYVRGTIFLLIDKLQELERYALLTTGAIWSWAIVNDQAQGIRFLWWTPLIIQSLFALRAYVSWRNLEAHLKYLSAIEEAIGLNESEEIAPGVTFGFGTYLRSEWRKPPKVATTGTLFWVSLVTITLLINLLLPL